MNSQDQQRKQDALTVFSCLVDMFMEKGNASPEIQRERFDCIMSVVMRSRQEQPTPGIDKSMGGVL